MVFASGLLHLFPGILFLLKGSGRPSLRIYSRAARAPIPTQPTLHHSFLILFEFLLINSPFIYLSIAGPDHQMALQGAGNLAILVAGSEVVFSQVG